MRTPRPHLAPDPERPIRSRRSRVRRGFLPPRALGTTSERRALFGPRARARGGALRGELASDPEVVRPRTRGDCRPAERPCPYVSCKHHLYLDIHPTTGAIKLNFPDLEVWELPDTCALDVADRGSITLEEVGALLNLTRERVYQIEAAGIKTLRAAIDLAPPPPPARGAADAAHT